MAKIVKLNADQQQAMSRSVNEWIVAGGREFNPPEYGDTIELGRDYAARNPARWIAMLLLATVFIAVVIACL